MSELQTCQGFEFIDQIVEINKKSSNYKSYGNTQDLINLFVEHILSHDLVDHATGLINLEKMLIYLPLLTNIDQDSRPIAEISARFLNYKRLYTTIKPLGVTMK